MPYEYTLSHRIEFSETDMAGIVHFANFYRMMENAEHAFFRSLGHSIHDDYAGVHIGWPRVNAACDFLAPLKFEETVEIQLIVAEVRNRSIRYAVRFWKVDGVARTEVARGTMTSVCAALDKVKGGLAATPIPEELRQLIQPAPAEMLTSFQSATARQS
jgi:acyl-CoA thioester hydrolase